MNIPKKVKVGPHVYKIVYEKYMAGDHNALGQSVHDRGIIRIDPDMSQSQLEDTFLHEVLHCIEAQVKVFVGDDKDGKEDAVQRLAPFLLSFIKDNPDIFK